MKRFKKIYVGFILTAFGALYPAFAFAQKNLFFSGDTFCDYMTSVFDFAVAIVGSLTVVMIIFGGVAYATSGGNSERVKSAKDIIIASIVGMILVLGSYLFFQTLAPSILQCKDKAPAQGTSKGFSGGTGSGSSSFPPLDRSVKDICEGKSVSTSKEGCEKTSGTGKTNSCLKGKTGWCVSSCGEGQSAVSAFKKMVGTCIITNNCAFTTSRALIQTGCSDFKYNSSTTAVAKQVKAWGFKEYTFDPNDPKSLDSIKPGAILIFKGHTAMFAGNNKMIDAVPGWYNQCGLGKKNGKILGPIRYSDLIGKDKACTKKNPYPNRNPNNPGLDKTMSAYTNKNSHVQCIATHSFKNGKPYNTTKYPLLKYYQRD